MSCLPVHALNMHPHPRAAIERGCSIRANFAQTLSDKHRSKGTPAVRALSACSRTKGGKDVLGIATPFNLRPQRRGTKDRTGVKKDPRTAMNFVLVNHRTLRRPSCCAACLRPLQRGYLRDLSTDSPYCSVECYSGHAADSLVRSLAKVDPFGLAIPFMRRPTLTIDVASAVFDSAERD
jgi:hypothetical protein